MKWLQRHPVEVNLVLSFVSAICAGLWTNYVTGNTQMTDRHHLLVILAVSCLVFQYWFNKREATVDKQVIEHLRKQVINDLLDLGLRFVTSHAKVPVATKEIRVIVHLLEQASPGVGYAIQTCLVPRYWQSPVSPRDYGPIPLEFSLYKAWYVNVKACHSQQVLCEEPDLKARPDDPKAHVNTPSHFESRSVLAVPIWSRVDSTPKIIGTMTFDSKRSMAELDWCANGGVSDAMKETLDTLADAVGKVLTHDEAKE